MALFMSADDRAAGEDDAESAARPVAPERAWERIKGAGRLDGAALARLQALAAWREGEAQERNRPRGFIITDPVLVAIARDAMTSPDELAGLDDLHPRARKRYAGTIATLVEECLESGRTLPELPQAGLRERSVLKAMRALVAEQAEALELEPTVLATKRDMEEMLFSPRPTPLPERLSGWRKAVVGEPLQRLLDEAG